MIDRVLLFQKSEDKKQFSVLDARSFIEEISLRPYDGEALYILRDFDEATTEAMNACLKTFEEPPSYAHILIVVKSPEKLLETIRSRSLLDYHEYSREPLPESLELLIRSYYHGDTSGFIAFLQRSKYDDATALSILRSAAGYA
jgi:DNA polymerase III delta prime subunit